MRNSAIIMNRIRFISLIIASEAQRHAALRALLFAGLLVLGTQEARAGSYSNDFATSMGTATPGGSAALDAGQLRLTPDASFKFGNLLLPDLDPNSAIQSFTVSFNLTIDAKGRGDGADGFSLNFANPASYPAQSAYYSYEDGAGSGLKFRFITYTVNKVVIGGMGETPAFTNAVMTDGTKQPVTISYDKNTGITLTYRGQTLTATAAQVNATGFNPQVGFRFFFGARCGGGFEDHLIDDVVIATTPRPNSAPVISNQTFPVAENKANGSVVGSVTATDLDGHSLSYAITAGNTNGAFAINAANGQITVSNSSALVLATTPIFTLTVQATDNGSPNLSASATVTVNLQPPPYASSTPFAVDTRNYTASAASTVHTDSFAYVAADTVPGSLRQAISNAPAGGNVLFAPALSGATITLGGSQLTIDKDLTINASTLSAGLTVAGNNASRVFNINAGNVVTLESFTVTGGNSANGAGVNCLGTVTLNKMTIHGNSATQDGGGIRVSGSATLNNSTVAGNSATLTGGGIQTVDAGTLTLNHGTVSGNAAPTGGGLHLSGISSAGMANSIIAGNAGGSDPNISGAITATGNNISSGNPKLAPLGNYGGLTPTMPPLPGSPAIEGAATTTLGTDQRGNPRPRGPLPDIGAVEAGSLLSGVLADTDNDGIPDVMEGSGSPYPHLTVGINDSGVDTDGDGSTDAAEIGNMTDLNNAGDSFRVLNFALAPGFNPLTNPLVSITFRSFPGLNYEVETDNAMGTFEPVPGTLLPANGFTQTMIVLLEPGLRSFARVRRR